MKKPRVIAADIDETLVKKHQELTPRTAETIIRLRQEQVYFGIASGRPKNELAKLLDEWRQMGVENDFIIASNGCVLIDNLTGQEHEYYFMPPEKIREIIEMMRPLDCNPNTMIDGYTWNGRDDFFVQLAQEYLGIPVRICQSHDYHELWRKPVGKLLFRLDDAERMPEIEAYAAAHPIEGVIGFKTGANAFEFTDERAGKGVALENFCGLHDIPMSEVMAFGDTSNDNQMLKVAGIGVCMLNGSDDTKACADQITELDVDHEGFADFIARHVFQDE